MLKNLLFSFGGDKTTMLTNYETIHEKKILNYSFSLFFFIQEGRTMADRDGGSSFVVSPNQQLYRLHVS